MAVFMYRVLSVVVADPDRWLRQSEISDVLIASAEGESAPCKQTLHRALVRLVGEGFLRSRLINFKGRKVSVYRSGPRFEAIAKASLSFCSSTPEPPEDKHCPDLVIFQWPTV